MGHDASLATAFRSLTTRPGQDRSQAVPKYLPDCGHSQSEARVTLLSRFAALSLNTMERQNDEESYYTSLWDASVWSVKCLGTVILIAAAVAYIKNCFRGDRQVVTLKAILAAPLIAICSGLFLGSLLFCFGWLGRVTVSGAGIKAPLYSGRRVFLPWQELQAATKGSLNGWPCILVAGSDSKSPLYLMVLGTAKQRMVENIRTHAGANNALTRYLFEHGA